MALPSLTGRKRRTAASPAPIRTLQNDHRNFRRLLDLFEAELMLFHRGDEPDYALMRDIVLYMTQYPDQVHHPNEDLIFDRLQKVDPGARLAVIGLLREHEELIAKGSELFALLDEIVGDAFIARDTVESAAHAYVSGMRAHIEKEEGTLFPLAVSRLGQGDWAAIAAASRRYDDPLFGARLDPGYRAIFERLSGPGGTGSTATGAAERKSMA